MCLTDSGKQAENESIPEIACQFAGGIGGPGEGRLLVVLAVLAEAGEMLDHIHMKWAGSSQSTSALTDPDPTVAIQRR